MAKKEKVINGLKTNIRQQLAVMNNDGIITIEDVLRQAKIIEDACSSLNEDEKKIFYSQKLKEIIGVDVEDVPGLIAKLGLEPSKFWKNMGLLPTQQNVRTTFSNYKFGDIIPIEMVENGTLLKFYKEFTDADDLPAYKVPTNYVEVIYNPDQAIGYEEQWYCYKDIHKGLQIPDISMNDFTTRPAIFFAMLGLIEYHVNHAIDKVFYKMRLEMTQDPSAMESGKDWSTIKNDYTLTGTDEYDMLEKVHDLFDGLSTISRTNQPEEWKPEGAEHTQEIALDMSDYIWLVPKSLKNHIDIAIRSGRYNEDYLNVLPSIMAIDYEKSFGEYIGATGFGLKWNDADTRLIPKGGHHKIIRHFQGARSQPLGVLIDVYHRYDRVGHVFDKEFPLLKVKLNFSGGSSGATQKVEVTNQVDVSKLATSQDVKAIGTIVSGEVKVTYKDGTNPIPVDVMNIGAGGVNPLNEAVWKTKEEPASK